MTAQPRRTLGAGTPEPKETPILSPAARPVIETTLPVVATEIGTISELFYTRLFDAAPHLGTDLFNRSNQADRSQQKALAGSIAAFATLLVDEHTRDVDTIMARIAAKHASLGVLPAHYDLVRTHLFAAITEVLGDAVTPAVADAWSEVYDLMANSLITQENRLYAHAGVPPGNVWQQMTVIDREAEGAHSATLYLKPLDNLRNTGYLPGQYVSVRVLLQDGTEQIRQYTVTQGRTPDEWALSIKRVPDGLVSPVLVDHVRPGAVLLTSPPFGSLVVDDSDDPLLLISAGVGITHSIAALQHLQLHQPNRRLTVLHVDRTPYEHLRRVEFDGLVKSFPHARLHVRYTEFDSIREDGRHPLEGIALPRDARTYICGPIDFMRAIRGALVGAGLPPESVHYEAFAPGSWLGTDPEEDPSA